MPPLGRKSLTELKSEGFSFECDGDLYEAPEGTLNDGLTDAEINMTTIGEAKSVEIINDSSTSGDDFTVKFNATTNDAVTIKQGETRTFSKFPITRIFFSNSSGSNIPFRTFIMGYRNR